MKKRMTLLATAAIACATMAQAQYKRNYYNSTSVNQIYVPPATYHVLGKGTSVQINYSQSAPLTNDQKSAIDYAIGIYSAVLSSTASINVVIGPDPSLASSVLASSGPMNIQYNFSSSDPKYVANVLFPDALANKLHGSDLDNSASEIEIKFNPSLSYYYGTDGNCPSNKYDFVTLILHELSVGLGATFSSVREVPGTGIVYGYPVGSGTLPIIFDTKVVNGSNTALTSQTSGSTAFATYATSGNLFFSGSSAYSANSNTKPKLNAPGTFINGKSIAYLDPTTFPNQLFKPEQNLGEAIHTPGALGVGMLNDIGWSAMIPNGIEDDANIWKYNPSSSSNPYSSNPDRDYSQGGTYNFYAQFSDEYPYGDYAVSNSWKLELLYNGGRYLLNSSNAAYYTMVVNSVPSGYDWQRDGSGRIKAILSLAVTDNDNVVHRKSLDATVTAAPNEPNVSLVNASAGSCDNYTVSFYAAGASSYTVAIRELNSGTFNPWVSTSVAGDQLSYNYTGLNPYLRYEFKVTATNGIGSTTSPVKTRYACQWLPPVFAPNPFEELLMVSVNDQFFIREIFLINETNPQIVIRQQFDGKSSSVTFDGSSVEIPGNYIIKVMGTEDEVVSGIVTKRD